MPGRKQPRTRRMQTRNASSPRCRPMMFQWASSGADQITRRSCSTQACRPQKSPVEAADKRAKLNRGLMDAERALLFSDGLPKRPWFRHSIYAPGEFTGYAAVVIPSVTEAVDNGDAKTAQEQLNSLAAAIAR